MDLGKYNPIKERQRLAELVRELKAKKEIKLRSKIKQVALELARKNQVVYGSTVSAQYAPKIKPRDIDISVEKPREAAERLREELLKRGISRKVKEKYIKQIRKKIYEIGNVSYSPLTKSKKLAAIDRRTALQQEVLALSGTIAEPTAYYRSKRDLAKLKHIAKKLKKEKRKEFETILRRLKFEQVARTFFYTTKKTEKLRKQRIYIDIGKDKFKRYSLKTKERGFLL